MNQLNKDPGENCSNNVEHSECGCQLWLKCAVFWLCFAAVVSIAAPALSITNSDPTINTNHVAQTNSPVLTPEPTPVTSRDFFNAGTRRLHAGKFREAEAFLQTALAMQDAKLQPPALYNLGHVRFAQGAEELKKSLEARPTARRGRAAAERAAQAIEAASDALAGNDVQTMVAAYLQGRGARRELKAATAAVRRALEIHGSALRKWQRSLDDFRGAAELNPADTNAQRNAEIVERAIAKLVDSIQEMQQAAMAMEAQRGELGNKLKELQGKIPAPLMPPGAAGEEEEEEEEGEEGDKPPELRAGQEEGPSKDGQEISISPEEAGWLLEGFRLEGGRRLPMGPGEQGQPRDRNRPNW